MKNINNNSIEQIYFSRRQLLKYEDDIQQVYNIVFFILGICIITSIAEYFILDSLYVISYAPVLVSILFLYIFNNIISHKETMENLIEVEQKKLQLVKHSTTQTIMENEYE